MPTNFTPEQINKLRNLGYKGALESTESNPYKPEVDDDLTTETTPQITQDAKALQNLKTEELPGQASVTEMPYSGLFGLVHDIARKSANPEANNYDHSPLLMAARMFDPTEGANYPNGANGFGDPSTFAKDVVAQAIPTKGKTKNRASSKVQTAQPAIPTPTKPQLTDIDAGTGSINTVDGMRDALETSNQMMLGNRLGKIGDKVLAGLTRTNPQFQDNYDQGIAQAKQIPTDFKELAGQEDNDPNSPKSNAFKQYLKTFGINLKGDVSAATAQSLLPAVYKQFEGEQNRQMKQAISAQTLAERQNAAEQSNQTRQLIAALGLQGKQYAADKGLEGRQKSLDASMAKFDAGRLDKADTQMQKDPGYIAGIKGLDEARNLKNQITEAANNPISSNMLPVMIARAAMAGAGKVAQIEVEKAGGSKALLDTAYRIRDRLANGTLDPKDLDWMNHYASITEQSAQQALDEAQKRASSRYASRTGKDYSDVLSKLSGSAALPQNTSSPKTTQYTPGQIITLKDGRKFRVKSDGDSLEPM